MERRQRGFVRAWTRSLSGCFPLPQQSCAGWASIQRHRGPRGVPSPGHMTISVIAWGDADANCRATRTAHGTRCATWAGAGAQVAARWRSRKGLNFR